MNLPKSHELPVPVHFAGGRAGEVWRVPYAARAAEAPVWAKKHGLKSADKDSIRVCLLAIDIQNTFCIPGHELFVGGHSGKAAMEDTARLCDFVYRHLGIITDIIPTMDTHHLMQIFHPVFWVDQQGYHPLPAQTIISVDDVKSGKWRVNPALARSLAHGDYEGLQRFALHYVERLQESGKYPLMVWPYHAMLGGIGHALVSLFEEAVFFHGVVRNSQPRIELKGERPLTENYSALAPEVLDDEKGKPVACRNQPLIDKVLSYDAVIIAGQAKSHCVAWTIEDLLGEMLKRNPQLTPKIYLLEDCTSPVVVPGGIDFTKQADQAFQRFAEAGMHLVKSTDPITKWPNFPLEA